MKAFTPLPLERLWEAFDTLQRESEGAITVVRLEFEEHLPVDVFRVTQIRQRPCVHRLRGFCGPDDDTATEFVGLLLSTIDGRAYLASGNQAVTGFGHAVVDAKTTTRTISELAERVATRIRQRFE